MTREGFLKHKDVLNAWLNGADIEYKKTDCWDTTNNPRWRSDIEYRIKETPDTIDWSHVHPDYNWMARGPNGATFFSEIQPALEAVNWVVHINGSTSAKGVASYKRGTCDWKDSLVERQKT